MRAHYLQHVPFEGLGSMEPWLREAGYTITHTRLFESVVWPDLAEVDLLIIMGGPMSVNDEAGFPWLSQEEQFIRNVIRSGKPVLGVCLGAQLIAKAMGGRVYPSRLKEIGWFPVEGVSQTDQRVFCFPPSIEVFHWHGETFDLPPGAIHLAKSEGCENQGFQLGQSVVGLQFHLETTPALAHEIVSNCSAELIPSRYVQSAETILAAEPEKYQRINNLMSEVLSFLHRSQETIRPFSFGVG